MQKVIFLLLNKFKNTESAQLCAMKIIEWRLNRKVPTVLNLDHFPECRPSFTYLLGCLYMWKLVAIWIVSFRRWIFSRMGKKQSLFLNMYLERLFFGGCVRPEFMSSICLFSRACRFLWRPINTQTHTHTHTHTQSDAVSYISTVCVKVAVFMLCQHFSADFSFELKICCLNGPWPCKSSFKINILFTF